MQLRKLKQDICGLLSGVDITKSTVMIMRNKLFGNDEAEKENVDELEADVGTSKSTSRKKLLHHHRLV